MKISQPFVLLLGGILSASSIGCSAINAVVSDYRPNSKSSADRMAAIGRVFENQGRYDQAEVMYRKALKKNPKDTVVREQLQQLADRRNGKTFGADSTSSALAMADSVSGSGANRARLAAQLQAQTVAPKPQTQASVQASTKRDVEQVSSDSGWEAAGKAKVAPAVAVSASASTKVKFVPNIGSVIPARRIPADEILAVVDSPAENAPLLLAGLSHGDTLETQCLAAALLGDCSPEDLYVRAALKSACSAASDPRLRIAVCDSQIQRGECDAATAQSLISLMKESTPDIQIQACSDVGLLSESVSRNDFVTALKSLLDSPNSNVRGIAAATLGEFSNLDADTITRLQEMTLNDEDSDAQEGARATLDRANASEG